MTVADKSAAGRGDAHSETTTVVSDSGVAPAGGGGAPSSVFLDACLRRLTPYTPVWIMRQAGRYLPEYRELRSRVDFATLTRSAELAAEVTLQPVKRFPLDAAILFSDIMTPLQGLGVAIDFEPGPIIREPIRTRAQIDALPELFPERDVPFVLDAIRLVRRAAPREVPLIGFAGAPFTLLCYLVSGRPSKEFGPARAFLYSQPEAAEALIDRLADAMAVYLAAQAAAGAQALMLFESWAGLLGPREFRRFALRGARRTLAALRRALGRDGTSPSGGEAAPDARVPLIYYANQGSTSFDTISTLEADVIGVDWRTPLGAARRALGPLKALQGNLDPAVLFAPRAELERQIDVVLAEGRYAPSHIFNLGHGIWPDTDPDAVARMVDYVHEKSVRD
ncbi:MAG TPA: uroporphyrinogen decarboxylase [Steroidobacteraceae bacterium]